MRLKLLLSGLLVCAVLNSFSQTAQVVASDTLAAKVLNKVVVTATRTQESLLRAPVSVETMSLEAEVHCLIFKSAYFRYPQDKTAIIILTNSDHADAYGIAFGVLDLLQTEDKKN
jgi:hypothetical protein